MEIWIKNLQFSTTPIQSGGISAFLNKTFHKIRTPILNSTNRGWKQFRNIFLFDFAFSFIAKIVEMLLDLFGKVLRSAALKEALAVHY